MALLQTRSRFVKLAPFAVALAFALASCAQPEASGGSDSGVAASTDAPAEVASAEVANAEAASAGEAAVPVQYFAEDNVAIRGADPVAYFTDSAYIPGSGEFTHEWQGVTWQFASAENRDTFAADPEAYAPQYGGFCAWAVSQGYTAEVDPAAWKIVDGKLYLNYDQNIQARWEKDIPGFISQADQNWPGVLAEG